jgi:hypothetical protein
MSEVTALKAGLLADIESADTLAQVEELRVGALGKSGVVTALLKTLGGMSPEERQEKGPPIHGLRRSVTDAHCRQARPRSRRPSSKPGWRAKRLDLTLPAPKQRRAGSVHPVSQVMDELAEIFADMGFRGRHRPGDRGRLAQLHRAQHPRKPSGAGDARHLLFPRHGCGRPRHAAAHAYLAGADPHHDVKPAADPHHRAGPGLSQRLATRPTRRCSTRSRDW